jgi:MFS family permease
MTRSNNSSATSTVRALKHRNYRLFFAGQGISLIGTWTQQIAVSWLVYSLTKSSLMLGIAGFASSIPVFFLTPAGGVCADRWNRHSILLLTQTLAMLLAFTLTFLFFKGSIGVWHVITISFLLGCVNAFDMPARHSFVNDIVSTREDLGNAIALNSFLFNSARLVGPAIAGVIIARSSEGVCFLINALSFVAVLTALSFMKIESSGQSDGSHANPVRELLDGLKYAAGFGRIRNLLLFGTIIGIVGMPYTVLMPAYAKEILGGNSETLGYLTGAAGSGALSGALFLARRKGADGLEKVIVAMCILFGSGLILLSFSRSFPLSLVAMYFCGLGLMLQMASSNVTIQSLVHDHMRGRIMSFYIFAFMGSAPFGSLLAGAAAQHIGLQHTLQISGVVCILTSSFFLGMLKTREDSKS